VTVGCDSRGPADLSLWLSLLSVLRYDAQITVGGVPCSSTSTKSFFVACLLPAIPNYVSNAPYDIVVTNGAGSLTLPGAVSFRDGPVLVGMTSCIDYAGPGQQQSGGGCQPGTAITLSGFRFANDPTVSILLQSMRGSPTNLSCLQPAVINSTTLSCVLPPATAASMALFIGQYVRLVVAFNSSTVLSNAVSTTVIDWPNPPLITAIGGSACAVSSSALAVSSCSPGGELVLYGSNLNGSGINIYNSDMTINGYSISSFYLTLLTVTDTAITIALPQWGEGSPPIQPNVTYVITGFEQNNHGLFRRLNAFTIAFAETAPSGPTDSESSGQSNRLAIIVGVIVPVVVLSLVTLAVLVWRCQRVKGKAGEITVMDSSASEEMDIEMK
jgi:hypothetical protein